MTILTVTEDLDPQLRSMGWVIRLMEEIYDSRQGIKPRDASFNVISVTKGYLYVSSEGWLGSSHHNIV